MIRERLLDKEYNHYVLLREAMYDTHYERLMKIPDPELHKWIADIFLLAKPSSIYVIVGSEEDFKYVRKRALESGEEIQTKYKYKTVHFDGPKDLARDRVNTRILISSDSVIPYINTLRRDLGLTEIKSLFVDAMRNKTMYVIPICMGPHYSDFTLYGIQITDSAYVAHSVTILYRICYDEFRDGTAIRKGYFRFLHSVGELDERKWSKDIDKRRIYMDLEDYTTYSINTEYAGNALGPKKLALRLCIYKGYREGWLCEHMFIGGIRGPSDRITYFAGAFPAGCGKTATVMAADTIISDDLAIIKNVNGIARGVNPEIGTFGIIDSINQEDDPEIYKVLVNPETEVIFSNILLCDNGEPWWSGKSEPPCEGLNWNIRWWPGKNENPSHPNARFTTYLKYFEKLDPNIDNPKGVPISGIIFGGRDSDTHVPVVEAFDWIHGIILEGAMLESERTAAVLGEHGVREFNPFAILDFLSIPIGEFIDLHLRFMEGLEVKPRVFGVNYFLRDEKGNYLNRKADKRVWLKWMELRVHNDVEALETPIGYIPYYDDLVKLFKHELKREYKINDYENQFTIRMQQNLAKIERMWKIYSEIPCTPKLFDMLKEQKDRLKKYKDVNENSISPFKLDHR